ncbi:polyprenyl synthetase family protein [Fusibacter bizertensis]
MKVDEEILSFISKIDAALENKINQFVEVPNNDAVSNKAKKIISESMNYSLGAGGKRIRPLLLLEIAKSYGANLNLAVEFALAIEMIHTYSLIHDDLPSMDNDDLRRGKPTNHVVFGEDIAILTGDSLLNLSTEVMIEAIIQHGGEQRSLKAMREILNAAGPSGMILGQVADIKYHEEALDRASLDFINQNKTGKLLSACILAGAYLGGASGDEIEKLEHIGTDIGMLFQLVDDVLDVVGDEQKIGKRTQIDVKNNKTTYPSLLGLDETKRIISDLQTKLLISIDQLEIDKTFLKSLVTFLGSREF